MVIKSAFSINKETALSAAHIKANFSFAYADAFVVASALSHQGCILTGDPEIQAVEDQAEIQWRIPAASYYNYILVTPAPLR